MAVGAWLQRRDSEKRLEADQGQGLIGQKGFGPKRAPETHPKLLQSNQSLPSVCFARRGDGGRGAPAPFTESGASSAVRKDPKDVGLHGVASEHVST